MVAGEGMRAWFTQRMMELAVWWNGPITFEELKTAQEEHLILKILLPMMEFRCLLNGLHTPIIQKIWT